MRWWWGPLCTRPTHLVGIFIVQATSNNSRWIDMSPHSDTLSWFRVNQSLLFLLNVVCLAERHQIPTLLSLVWPDRSSNPRPTALEASTLTTTPPMLLQVKDITSMKYIFSQHTYISETLTMKTTWLKHMFVIARYTQESV